MAGYQNRLDLFSKDMLKRDGDIQDREIMRRHLGIDILSSGVFASGWWDYIDVDSLKVDGPTTSGYVLTADSAGVGTWQESSGGTSDTTVYIKTFTNSDLSSGVLSVSHGLSSTICQVSVFDNSNNFILPDEITLIDANSLTIDLSSFSTISGDWNCIVVSSGGDSTVSNFTDLQDTPSGYSGDADKFLKVDNDASGVVFSLLQENSSGTVTASGDIISTASGSYSIGTADTAFASGNFGTVVTDTLYATDAHIGADSLYIGDSKLTAPSGTITFLDVGDTNKTLNALSKRSIIWFEPGDAGTGTDISAYIKIPFNGVLSKAFARVKTAPVDADIIIDINKNGTTLWTSDKLTISDGANSGNKTVFDNYSVGIDDYFTIDIDQVGSTTAGEDLTIMLDMEVG